MAQVTKENDWRQEIAEIYGEDYILRQLAEEACELGQAALKLIRVWNNEKTPVEEGEALRHLLEEMADVLVMMDVTATGALELADMDGIAELAGTKAARMRERMLT